MLVEVIEDPSMLTKVEHSQPNAQESTSTRSTLKQNLADKLPTINTQVKITLK